MKTNPAFIPWPVLAAVWLGLAAATTTITAEPAAEMETVRLSVDGRAFVTGASNQPFRIWGVNYDRDATGENGRLLEDYWLTEWDTVREDFLQRPQHHCLPLLLRETRLPHGPEGIILESQRPGFVRLELRDLDGRGSEINAQK